MTGKTTIDLLPEGSPSPQAQFVFNEGGLDQKVTKEDFFATEGFGTASLKDVGTDANQIPTNGDLGTTAVLNTGTEPTEVPTNAIADVLRGKSIASIADLPTTGTVGQKISLVSYHSGWALGQTGLPYGGGDLTYDATRVRTDHDGGYVFSPSRSIVAEGLPAFLSEVVDTELGCWVREDSESVKVTEFGAFTYGANDSSASCQAALVHIAKRGGGKVEFPTLSYIISGTLFFTSNTEIDLLGSTLNGTGQTLYDNVMFNSGMLLGNEIISNFGPPETNRVTNSIVRNGIVRNCNIVFRVQNFNEGCEFSNIVMFDVGQAVYAFRCFYSRWLNCFVRYSSGSSTDTRGCFHFVSYVNSQVLRSLYVTGRKTAYVIDGGDGEGVDCTNMFNCGAEECEVGVQLLGALRPFTIDTCYFEFCSSIAVDAQFASAQNFSVRNTWFGECGKGIKVESWGAGVIAEDNQWLDSTFSKTFVDASNNTACFGTVEIPAQNIDTNGQASIPPQYSIGDTVNVEFKSYLYNNVTGRPTISQKFKGTFAELPMSGRAGSATDGIAFVNTTYSGVSPLYTYNTTQIPFEQNVCGVYHVFITDDVDTYEFAGRTYGNTVIEDIAVVGKTVTAFNNGGFLSLQIGQFTTPTNTVALSGVIRHV